MTMPDSPNVAVTPTQALEKCRDKFLEYERLHHEKRTDDGDQKAARNREMAEMCEAALSSAPVSGDLVAVDVAARQALGLYYELTGSFDMAKAVRSTDWRAGTSDGEAALLRALEATIQTARNETALALESLQARLGEAERAMLTAIDQIAHLHDQKARFTLERALQGPTP